MNLEETFDQYYTKKKINWVEMGKALVEAEEKGIDISKLRGKYPEVVGRTMSAYKFMKFNKPDFIKNPSDKVSLASVIMLPQIQRKIRETGAPDADKQFADLLDRTARGEVPSRVMILIQKKLNVEKEIGSRDLFEGDGQELNWCGRSMSMLENSVDALDYMIDQAMREGNTRNEINRVMGGKLYNLNVKINCVIDPEYLKMWKSGKVDRIQEEN